MQPLPPIVRAIDLARVREMDAAAAAREAVGWLDSGGIAGYWVHLEVDVRDVDGAGGGPGRHHLRPTARSRPPDRDAPRGVSVPRFVRVAGSCPDAAILAWSLESISSRVWDVWGGLIDSVHRNPAVSVKGVRPRYAANRGVPAD